MTITIRADGTIEHIGELPFPLPMTNIKRRRLSHIVPLNPLLRLAFRLLRKVFGERGRMAAFTRTWPCRWRATMVATGQTYSSSSRAECIRWELAMLASYVHLLQKTQLYNENDARRKGRFIA